MTQLVGPGWWFLDPVADRYGLPKATICGVIETESSWRPGAYRHEPTYSWLWPSRAGPFVPPGVTRATEEMAQRTSWGLMQVMGAVAREYGCVEPFVGSVLCDPQQGVEYGCKHLARLVQRFGSLVDGVAAYNAGVPKRVRGGDYANQTYVDKVIAAATRYA